MPTSATYRYYSERALLSGTRDEVAKVPLLTSSLVPRVLSTGSGEAEAGVGQLILKVLKNTETF